MKQFYKLLWIFPLAFVSFNAAGQLNLIRGKVVDRSSGKPVEYAYVLNYSQQQQIYCNTSGEFQLNAIVGDTLVLYAIGYLYQKIVVEDSMVNRQAVSLAMTQQSYELNEARIVPMGTYDDFRRRFVALDQPITETEKLNEYIADISRDVAIEAYNNAKATQTLENGVTFLSVGIYTPEEIERKKLAKLKEDEQVRDQIYYKFNPRVVKEITGLQEDGEIIEFMLFCKFPDSYLLEVNEYDLASRIAIKYTLFLKHKEDEKMMKNPQNHVDEMGNIFS